MPNSFEHFFPTHLQSREQLSATTTAICA